MDWIERGSHARGVWIPHARNQQRWNKRRNNTLENEYYKNETWARSVKVPIKALL